MIEVTDLYSRKLKLNRRAESVLKQAIALLNLDHVAINLIFVGDSKMHKMNREFLGHDYTTDVLSFGQCDDEIKTSGRIPRKLLNQSFPLFLGDIVVCLAEAKRQAKDRDISYEEEWIRYVCHGLLHLVGYDDKDPNDKKKMWAKQEQIVKKIISS